MVNCMAKSRQYSFINNQRGFTLSLIEGNELIDNINTIHNIGENAQGFYKKFVLSTQQLINFLKPGENLGFYIDSEDPYFRFKIEMAHNGSLRTLLLPEEFEDFPTTFTGKCRVTKVFNNKSPYTSVLEFVDHPVEQLVNEVMEKSYQTNSEIITGKNLLSTLMITKLPPTNINKKIEDYEETSLNEFKDEFSLLINSALELKDTDVKETEELFSKFGFNYIGSKEVKFYCPCSKERMINNIHSLNLDDIDSLFEDKSFFETRCDYCNTVYKIEKQDIKSEIQ